MDVYMYIFLWIASGVCSGIAADIIDEADISVNDLFWYSIFGLVTFAIAFGVIAMHLYNNPGRSKIFDRVKNFWLKTIIKNKKEN